MASWRNGALVALAALVLAVAPGSATANDGLGSVNIGSAEIIFNTGTEGLVSVTGTAVCALSGPVNILVEVESLELVGGGFGEVTLECKAPDEHLKWSSGAVVANARAGDRVLVHATATGAIVDEDEKETVLKQFR